MCELLNGISSTSPCDHGTAGCNAGGFLLDSESRLSDLRQENMAFLSQFQSKFQWKEYLALIDELADADRYNVIQAREYGNEHPDGKVTVVFRHDIDNAPFHALQMAVNENERNIHGSYYVLHSASYYGRKSFGCVHRYTAMDPLYKKIASFGNEIGVHNDLFTLQLTGGIDDLQAFQAAELAHWHKIGIDVSGTVCHGSIINSWGLNNCWLFAEFGKSGVYEKDGKFFEYGKKTVRSFGFDYEGYLLKYDQRLSDIGGYDAAELLSRLRACRKGMKVSVLLHPIHWRGGMELK